MGLPALTSAMDVNEHDYNIPEMSQSISDVDGSASNDSSTSVRPMVSPPAKRAPRTSQQQQRAVLRLNSSMQHTYSSELPSSQHSYALLEETTHQTYLRTVKAFDHNDSQGTTLVYGKPVVQVSHRSANRGNPRGRGMQRNVSYMPTTMISTKSPTVRPINNVFNLSSNGRQMGPPMSPVYRSNVIRHQTYPPQITQPPSLTKLSSPVATAIRTRPTVVSPLMARHSASKVMVKQAERKPIMPIKVTETAPSTLGNRQSQIQRRACGLYERSLRLEMSQMLYHGADELQTLIGLSSNSDSGKGGARGRQTALESKLELMLKSRQFRFREEELKKKSVAELARLIRRYEIRSGLSDAVSPAAARNILGQGSSSLRDICGVEQSVDGLKNHVKHLQRMADVEATDSSSDSDDEMELDRAKTRKYSSIASTSAANSHNPVQPCSSTWKWHRRRVWLGSRFNWLVAQISGLDYKVRQQLDICNQLKARKQPLVFDRSDEQSCARTRPLIGARPERKLVRTAGTFRWNSKMKRLSEIHCGCYPPFSGCVLCTCRTNNVDCPPDTCSQSPSYRYALMDSSLHPVLSDSTAMSFERRMETHLKRLSINPKSAVAKRHNSSERQRNHGHSSKISKDRSGLKQTKSADNKRVTPLKLNIPHGALKLNAGKKLVKKSAAAQRKKQLKKVFNHKKQNKKKKSRQSDSDDDLSWSNSPYSAHNSTSKAPGKLSQSRRSTLNQTYDLDNIIIDSSVLAASKIEKLQYKEIVTPAWRRVDFSVHPSVSENTLSEDEKERTEDGCFESRHWLKESEEHNRFQVYKESVFALGKRTGGEIGTASTESNAQRSRSGSMELCACRPVEFGPPSIANPYPLRLFPLALWPHSDG